MTSYCLKCGEQGQPQRAVGLDEDGEAACAMHSVNARIPANLESVDSAVRWVARSPKGEFFVLVPRAERKWTPHASYISPALIT
jgi:hypothetical protein